MSTDHQHSVVPFVCPACEHRGRASAAFAGRRVRCPACDARFELPPPFQQPPDTELVPVEQITAVIRHPAHRPDA